MLVNAVMALRFKGWKGAACDKLAAGRSIALHSHVASPAQAYAKPLLMEILCSAVYRPTMCKLGATACNRTPDFSSTASTVSSVDGAVPFDVRCGPERVVADPLNSGTSS